MSLISQADAMAILAPHLDGLYTVATSPWDEYHTGIPADLLIAFCARTRASGIHNLMVRAATRYATRASGVRTFERKLMKGIVIDDCLAIRFKKLGEDNYSRGHYTKQVEEFRSQQVLDGIDAAHHLELGYVLNGFATEISEVRVVCPSGRGTAWSSTLDQSGMQPVVVDLLPQDKGPGGAIIKPKSAGVVIPIRKKTDED